MNGDVTEALPGEMGPVGEPPVDDTRWPAREPPPTPRRRREPPHDLDAEASTLGAMMLSTNAAQAVLELGLTPGHFGSPTHAAIFEAICAAVIDGAAPPEPSVVRLHLGATDLAATDDGKLLLALIAEAGSTSNANAYARRVMALADRRRLLGLSAELTEAVYVGDSHAIDAAFGRLVTEGAPADATAWASRVAPHLIDWSSIDDDPDTSWLLEPFLAEGRAHVLWAMAKTGKSLLALEAAVAIATGAPFLHSPHRAPRDVVYYDAEMTRSDVRERISDLAIDADLGRLHYLAQPDLPPLDTPDGGSAMRALARHWHADLVVIDTLTSTVAGEENDADTYRAVARFTTNPLKSDGVTTLRLDHGGKNAEKGQRGSSAKTEDVDVVWRLTPTDLIRLRLTATHRRLSWVPNHVDLIRDELPLHHRVVSGAGWPAGTADAAQALDDLGVALDATITEASNALRDAGDPRRRATVSAAQRWRNHGDRQHARPVDNPVARPVDNYRELPGNCHISDGPGTAPGTAPAETPKNP